MPTPKPLPPILSRLRLPVSARPCSSSPIPKLVIAQCKAGIVGSFPALNARPQSQLDEWLHEITEALAALRPRPSRRARRRRSPSTRSSTARTTGSSTTWQTCAKWKVPIVITSLGAREELNHAVHGWGGITLHDIIDDRFARKAVEKGADGLIAVAAGAGGHAGRWSPFALIQEIREWFDGPLILSGAIATGGAVLAAQAMGADLAYVGSPFIATAEAMRQRRLQAGDRRQRRRRHRLSDSLHRHPRQLSARVDRRRRARPRQLAARRSRRDEVPVGRPAPRRGATSGDRARASARSTRSCPPREIIARLARGICRGPRRGSAANATLPVSPPEAPASRPAAGWRDRHRRA